VTPGTGAREAVFLTSSRSDPLLWRAGCGGRAPEKVILVEHVSVYARRIDLANRPRGPNSLPSLAEPKTAGAEGQPDVSPRRH